MPHTTTYSFRFTDLDIDTCSIFSTLGYAKDKEPAIVRDDLEEALNAAADYCDIRGGVRIFDNFQLTQDKRHIILQGVNFAVGKIIGVQLREADSAALFVCTIGAGLETWSRELMARGDFLKGYLVDALASTIVETAVDKIHADLADLVPGKKVSNRYSPGYCGWDVAEQQKLFSLLPPHFCGITLTATSLMKPIKSVSGLIGLGPNIKKRDYTCRFCDMQDCVYRRQREKVLQE